MIENFVKKLETAEKSNSKELRLNREEYRKLHLELVKLLLEIEKLRTNRTVFIPIKP